MSGTCAGRALVPVLPDEVLMSSPEYISDQPWWHTYRNMLSPQSVRFAVAMSGCEPAPVRNACELAYGQGLALCIHAACNPDIAWTGTDFNAGHASAATALARAAELSNLVLHDLDLATFCALPALPSFDVVAVVGTWSWLPADDQRAVTDLLGRRLSSAGVFCLDHCVLPGMNGVSGLKRMFKALGAPDGADSDALLAQVPGVLQGALAFMDVNPAFVGQHWRLRNIVDDLVAMNPAYVAHEYMNFHWRPDYFSEADALMRAAGLAWIAPWEPADGVDDLHLSPRQSAFLREIAEPARREQLRDFVLSSSRRGDVWSKSAASARRDRSDLLRDARVVLVRSAADFDFRCEGGLGEVALARDLYAPLLEALSALRPLSMTKLQQAAGGRFSLDDICVAAAVLLRKQMIQVVNPDDGEVSRAIAPARALNHTLLQMTMQGECLSYLGSPLTGAGLKVPRMHQLFLAAVADGAGTPEACARFASSALAGAAAAGAAPVDAALVRRDADAFYARDLPIYSALMIAGTY